jgi:hypothetical protein
MNGNGKSSKSAGRSAGAPGRRPDRTTTGRRPGAIAVLLAAAAALALAACSGGPGSPQVASLGTSTGNTGSSAADGRGGSSAARVPKGNPTQLLDEWAACIRSHGDPNQADPTIDANKDIQIFMDNVPKALEDEVHGSTGPCSSYLLAAEIALRGGQPAPADDPAQDVRFAECMRANGVPNWPDPSANGETDFNGTGVDPNSPAVQNATKLCDKKTGIPYEAPGAEVPGVVVVTGCTTPPGMQCPSRPPSGGSGAMRTVPSGGSGGNG